VYLTGYGYDKKLLGKGVGQNKVEAGNWAANEAMHGENKALVDACEAQVKEAKEKRKLLLAEKKQGGKAPGSE
jgi:ribonuclease-3